MNETSIAFLSGFKKEAQETSGGSLLKQYIPDTIETAGEKMRKGLETLDEFRQGEVEGVEYEFDADTSGGDFDEASLNLESPVGPGKIDLDFQRDLKNDAYSVDALYSMKF